MYLRSLCGEVRFAVQCLRTDGVQFLENGRDDERKRVRSITIDHVASAADGLMPVN